MHKLACNWSCLRMLMNMQRNASAWILNLLRYFHTHAYIHILAFFMNFQGYYRRAEALRKMLENPEMNSRGPEGSGFAQVVADYFQCHRKTENSNIKAIYQAMVVATNNSQ